eukprot:scaffold16143_cov20-Tisochrysis_lutea.AAC.1
MPASQLCLWVVRAAAALQNKAACPELDDFVASTLALVELEREAEVAATQEASLACSPETAQGMVQDLVQGPYFQGSQGATFACLISKKGTDKAQRIDSWCRIPTCFPRVSGHQFFCPPERALLQSREYYHLLSDPVNLKEAQPHLLAKSANSVAGGNLLLCMNSMRLESQSCLFLRDSNGARGCHFCGFLRVYA